VPLVLPTSRRWIEPEVLKQRELLFDLYAASVGDPRGMGGQDRVDDKLLCCQVPLTPFGQRLDIHLPSRANRLPRPRTLYFRKSLPRARGDNADDIIQPATLHTTWELDCIAKRHASFHAGVGAGTTPDWHTWMNNFANAAAARGGGTRIHEQPDERSPYEGVVNEAEKLRPSRHVVLVVSSQSLLGSFLKSNSSLADVFRSNTPNFDFQELKQPPTSLIMMSKSLNLPSARLKTKNCAVEVQGPTEGRDLTCT